jgi:Ca2+-binding RTX toxin-like protein
MAPRLAAQVEPLETRRLFVNGTAGNDVIELQSVAGDALAYKAVVNGVVALRARFAVDTKPEDKIIGVKGMGGDDVITVDPALDARGFISGGEGSDTIVGGSRFDYIIGDSGDDLVFGKDGADEIGGGAGDDTLRGGDSHDSLYGDADGVYDRTTEGGADLLFGEGGSDVLEGAGGNDLLNGGDLNDRIRGGLGNDQCFGADGEDEMMLGRVAGLAFGSELGNDLLDGGAGIDVLSMSSEAAPFYVTLDGVANDGNRGDRVNVLPTFEVFVGFDFADGSVLDFSNSPVGVEASLEISDRSHRARLFVACIGSEFADRLVFSGRTPVQADGRAGDDSIFGSGLSDQLFGGPGNDSILGYAGNDTILGDDGDDYIEGKRDNDSIRAGAGNDVVFGDDDGSSFYGADTIQGNEGSDTLIGGGHADRIFGNAGRDLILGNGGNDVLYGGPDEADRVFGGAGSDRAAPDEKDAYESVEAMLT